MKRFLLVILLIPLLSGVDINNSVRPTRPMKGHFVSYPDLTNTPPVQCKPVQFGDQWAFGKGWLAGNVTHMGKVNMDMSPFWVNSCNFGPGPTQLTWAINGYVTGANGDRYSYTGELYIDGVTAEMTGDIHITGGTGKFKDAVGELKLMGRVTAENMAEFDTDGWIMY